MVRFIIKLQEIVTLNDKQNDRHKNTIEQGVKERIVISSRIICRIFDFSFCRSIVVSLLRRKKQLSIVSSSFYVVAFLPRNNEMRYKTTDTKETTTEQVANQRVVFVIFSRKFLRLFSFSFCPPVVLLKRILRRKVDYYYFFGSMFQALVTDFILL